MPYFLSIFFIFSIITLRSVTLIECSSLLILSRRAKDCPNIIYYCVNESLVECSRSLICHHLGVEPFGHLFAFVNNVSQANNNIYYTALKNPAF